jgi:hypothetical protein
VCSTKEEVVTQDAAAPGRSVLLVEAEAFIDKGGWVVDQQFMDQMGSPYLLAHGLGVPVKDAVTTANFPGRGTYWVWIRTCDWTAPWSAAESPGRFELLVQGRPIQTVFGNGGRGWHWQAGGLIEVQDTTVELRLHDLTGFEGRCDAIAFTTDAECAPPSEPNELAEWRKRALGLPDVAPEAAAYDLVVAGGGVAGVCCAVSAARLGLKVALIHDRPVLGGNNSSEVGVAADARLCLDPFPRIGTVTRCVADGLPRAGPGTVRLQWDREKLRIAQAERTLDLFLNWRLTGIEKDNGGIAVAIAKHIEDSTELRFRAPLFADCTGDGNLGYLGGAEYRQGREGRDETQEPLAPARGDRLTLATSNLWFAVPTLALSVFPLCPWAVTFSDEMYRENREYYRWGFPCYETAGGWLWQSGWDRDTVADAERIRDYNFMAIYGHWSFLKNQSRRREEFSRWRLAWVAYIAGKRESRRLLGDYVLSQHDLVDRPALPDAFVMGSYMIDLHRPRVSGHFPHGEFVLGDHITDKRIEPYPIPWRCLYSRNVPKLMMGGRCLSATHVAHSSARIINTTGMMGEVMAMGAFLCRTHNALPREIYERHLSELRRLAARGVPERAPS